MPLIYQTLFKPGFLADNSKLPRNLQEKAARAIEHLRTSAETPRGNTIKKLRDFDTLWRYRMGDHRLVYAVAGEFVCLLAIGPKSSVYKRCYEDVDVPERGPFVEELLKRDTTSPSRAAERALESLEDRRKSSMATEEPLPQKLTRRLLTQWMIPEQHHSSLLACKTESGLLRCKVPGKVGEQVLELLYPRPIDQIAQQADFRLPQSEDLIRHADGDLLGFLLMLDDDQDRFVSWAIQGPTLVKGGPGSGKSTVALYRARELIQKGAGRVLFTTYTNALVRFSRQLLEQLTGDLPAEITVSTLDRIARQIVRECDGDLPSPGGVGDIKAALDDARAFSNRANPDSRSRLLLSEGDRGIRKDYLAEEIEWVIEGRDLRKLDDYLKTDRTGRGYGFDEPTRRAMWRTYLHVRSVLKKRKVPTYGQLRSRALELVKSGQWGEKWDAVIIDEAQDLTPTAMALCIELCKDTRGLFLTADASQSLYNRGFRWKDVHERLRVVGRTRILKTNYRSTRQIALAAAEIVQHAGAGDDEALDQTYVRVGPRPVIHVCKDTEEQTMCIATEIEQAAEQLRLPVSAAGVLVPTNELAEETASRLRDWELPARYMKGSELDLEYPGIKVMTIHSAKGLEFPIVAIPYVEKDILPRPLETAQAEDLEEHMAEQRRLLFVGCSRAMRRLVVTTSSHNISPFLRDLSRDAWIWRT